MSSRKVVLVIEPHRIELQELRIHVGQESIPVEISSAARAVRAIHALHFDAVIVPVERVEEMEYTALFSTMSLVAPHTRIIFASSSAESPLSEAMSTREQFAESSGAAGVVD